MCSNSVCCIFVTYNPSKKFIDNFKIILNQVEKVVIVDNGSTLEDIEMLKELAEYNKIELILNNENLGIATALNSGVKYALSSNYKWILTMDHDSEAAKDMIQIMLNQYDLLGDKEKEEIGSLFPRFVEKSLAKDIEFQSEEYEYVPYEITSGNLVKSEVFNKIGLFDDELFIDMVDTDFCMRLNKYGIKMIRVNKAILLHNLGETEQKKIGFLKFSVSNHSPIRRYYMTRNRFYIWNKYSYLNIERIEFDKKCFKKELIKIILCEKHKYEKLKFIIKGYKDYKTGIKGKLQI